MYVLLNDEGNVLVDEVNLITGEHKTYFSNVEHLKVVNSYRNKDIRLKKFFPWYSFEGEYHLVKKSKWLRSERRKAAAI